MKRSFSDSKKEDVSILHFNRSNGSGKLLGEKLLNKIELKEFCKTTQKLIKLVKKTLTVFFGNVEVSAPGRQGLKYTDCILCRELRHSSSPQKYPWYNIKLLLSVRLQYGRSGECGVPLHFNYSQLHSHAKGQYLFCSNLWVKQISFKIIHLQ